MIRAGTLVAGLTLIAGIGGSVGTHSNEANIDTPVVAACSVQGEDCNEPSLDGSRQFFVSHRVYSGGCATADLHVIQYPGEEGGRPIIATWCS